MSVHYSETFSRVFRDTINWIENTEQESSPRGLKVKERLLATLPINPIYPIANFSDRKFNWKYFAGELAWYLKKDRDIDYINNFSSFWKGITNPGTNEINSNYGHLIFSDKYHNQYGQVLDELIRNPDSRRACMVYNRPSIWMEYNENDKNDFICTNSVTYYIRDNILHAVVQMRSNDVVFGYKNDYAWQFEIMNRLVKDWNDCKFEEYDTGDKISLGSMIWQVQNLHVYERHFHLVK